MKYGIIKSIAPIILKMCLLLLLLRGLVACKHQHIELIFEPTVVGELPDSCRLKTIRYKIDIEPMITTYCVSSVCHGDNAPPRGINLSNYDNLITFIKEDSTRFLGTVRHEGFYYFMPIERAVDKLDSCSIRRLETWIRLGMPNN